MSVSLNELTNYLDDLLQVAQFKDYCPNGLQVQGRPEIKKIISGVSANQELIEQACLAKADCLLVHHGFFWRGESPCITGVRYNRLKTLLKHDISLLAYHIPLDAHIELGNNVQLGQLLNFRYQKNFAIADYTHLGFLGELAQPLPTAQLADHIAEKLGQAPFVVGDGARVIKTIAWCTGAAQDALEAAAAQGVDAFLTGEVSERTVAMARELNVVFLAAGHHATERYGIQALGEHVADKFSVAHAFVDIANEV